MFRTFQRAYSIAIHEQPKSQSILANFLSPVMKFVDAAKRDHFININEVTMRDGLQGIKDPIYSKEDKLAAIKAISSVGFKYVEIGSIVSKKAVPQMATTSEIIDQIETLTPHDNTKFGVLVAHQAGIDSLANQFPIFQRQQMKLAFVTSISESFCKTNMRTSVSESFKFVSNNNVALNALNIPTRIYVSCCFTQPDGSKIPTNEIVDYIRNLATHPMTEIVISDTFGTSTTEQLYDILNELNNSTNLDVHLNNNKNVTMHFHEGTNMHEKIITCVACNVTSFDTTIVANLGGCSSYDTKHNNLNLNDLLFVANQYNFYHSLDMTALENAIKVCKF